NQGPSEVSELIDQLTTVARVRKAPKPFSYYLLQDDSGKKIAGNLPPMAPVFETTSIPPPAGTPNAKEHVVVAEGRYLPDGTYLFVGADSHWLIEAHEHILSVFLWATGITILVTIVIGLALSQGAARRIDEIVAVCRAIADNQWDKRVPLDASR